MRLIGDNGTIELGILEQSYTNSEDESDKEWLEINIKIQLNGFRAHFRTQLMRNDFERFIDSLSNVLVTQKGDVEFNTLEESFYLKGSVSYSGNIDWIGSAVYPVGDGNKLIFKLETDFYQLERIKNELIVELSNLTRSAIH